MAVARKMPGDLGRTVKKATVKKSSPIKYSATKKPNQLSSKEYIGTGDTKAKIRARQTAMKKQDAVARKNAAANRARDTKPVAKTTRRRAI